MELFSKLTINILAISFWGCLLSEYRLSLYSRDVYRLFFLHKQNM